MPEEILVNDAVQRRFQYQLLLPLFKHHRGTIDVIDLGDDTCLVVYSTEADPRAMALMIAGGTAGALDELKRQMELGQMELGQMELGQMELGPMELGPMELGPMEGVT
jgi:hypothetical protein